MQVTNRKTTVTHWFDPQPENEGHNPAYCAKWFIDLKRFCPEALCAQVIDTIDIMYKDKNFTRRSLWPQEYVRTIIFLCYCYN